MRKKKAKIVVVPHYSGSEKKSHVFRIVITEQIQKKLEKSAQNKTTPNNSA